MSTVVQGILLAVIGVLLFGLIIFIHEFGHFFTAKLSHVCVNEFSIGIGSLLQRGIGDTLRVSLTADPAEEIRTGRDILSALGLRGGVKLVSCPTCGRTKIDLIGLANKVEAMVANYPLDIRVAVMGCVVNGPGEAREADIGIAGGDGIGLLIKHGEIVQKLPEDQLLDALRTELENWNE